MSEKIAYVKHPLSPEEKKKLREQGYKILDKRYDPNPKKKVEKVAPKKDEKGDK